MSLRTVKFAHSTNEIAYKRAVAEYYKKQTRRFGARLFLYKLKVASVLHDLQNEKFQVLRFFGAEQRGVVGCLRFDFHRSDDFAAFFRAFHKHFFK